MKGVSKPAREALRAVGILMEQIEETMTGQAVVAAVLEQIQSLTDKIILPDLETHTEGLRNAATVITRTIDVACEDLQRHAAEFRTAAESAPLMETTDQPVNSYANAVRQQPPSRPAPTSTLVRNANQQRQILIDKAPEAATNGLLALTEKELVAKANLALEAFGTLDPPEGIAFVSATKLRNGGVVLQMNTEENASWVRDRMKDFLSYMGGEYAFKVRTMTTVAEFVPVSFDPDTIGALRLVEDVNALPQNSLVSARWIKPPQFRREGQNVAHMILGFATREAANAAIERRIAIEGKSVVVRKLLQDPLRCMKCKKSAAGHVAANCKSIHEACVNCGGMHRKTDCTVIDETQFNCVNCKNANLPHAGHGAADRRCPVFRERTLQIRARNPDNQYRFFPTDDPKTWEPLNQVDPNLNNQEATWQDGNRRAGGWAQSANERGGIGTGRLVGAPRMGGRGFGEERSGDGGYGLAPWGSGAGRGRGLAGGSGRGRGTPGDRYRQRTLDEVPQWGHPAVDGASRERGTSNEDRYTRPPHVPWADEPQQGDTNPRLDTVGSGTHRHPDRQREIDQNGPNTTTPGRPVADLHA